ncbi:MAG: SOS response-associated peptidase [Cytophagales bacterium]|nr:SOS response-associated peptidase [Cytophagales bacterium]
MCDRYSLTLPKDKLTRRFRVRAAANWEPQYNIAPGDKVAVITDEENRQLTWAAWGLPYQSTGLTHQLFVRPGNKPIPKTAQLLNRRCLVLADGYYVWRKISRRGRVPFRVTLKWNMPFAFAGVWQRNENGETACAVLTTAANPLVEPVAERMPVILSLEREQDWLKPDVQLPDLLDWLAPYPTEQMRIFPVSAQVNFGNYVLNFE